MSEDNTGQEQTGEGQEGGESATAADGLKNFKAEVDRKLSNIEQTITAQNQQLLNQIAASASASTSQAEPAGDGDSIESMLFDNPAKAIERIKQEAKQEVMQEVNKVSASESQKQQTLQRLVSNYPELSDQTSDMTKKAYEIYGNLSPAEQNETSAYELVVARAAAELGVLPVSKRQKGHDEFTLQGGSSRSAAERRADSKGEVSDNTRTVAELMGLKLDKKTEKRLSELSKLNPKDWLNYKKR